MEISIGKIYKGQSTGETELDATIETSTKIIFIEAKLYSAISLKSDTVPYDQIAKSIRVGLDYAPNNNKEFYLIFLDIAPRSKIYGITTEGKVKKKLQLALYY